MTEPERNEKKVVENPNPTPLEEIDPFAMEKDIVKMRLTMGQMGRGAFNPRQMRLLEILCEELGNPDALTNAAARLADEEE